MLFFILYVLSLFNFTRLDKNEKFDDKLECISEKCKPEKFCCAKQSKFAVQIFLVVIGFFVLLTITGWQVLQVLEGEMLVSLTWVPIQLTQSVIPIGGALFVICELLSLPKYWKSTSDGVSLDHAEIEEEVENELQKVGAR